MVKEGIVLHNKVSQNHIEDDNAKIDVIKKVAYTFLCEGCSKFLTTCYIL